MKFHLYRTNLLRARWMPNFALAVLAGLTALLLTAMRPNRLWDDALGALCQTKTNSTGVVFFTLCIVPAIPLALTYAQDVQTRFFYFCSLRGGLRRCVRCHFQIAVLLGALTSGISDALFVIVMLLRGFPLGGTYPDGGDAFFELIRSHILLYFAAILLNSMLSAAITAGWAALAAAGFCHPLSGLAAPLIVYMLWLRVVPSSAPTYFRATGVFSGYSGGTAVGNLLIKLVTTVLFCAVSQTLTVRIVKRRQQNA